MMRYTIFFIKIYIGGGVMILQSLRRQRNFYALFFVFAIISTIGIAIVLKPEAAIALGVVSVTALILLVRKSRLLYDATLMWDNRILAVPSVLISTTEAKEQNHVEEAVVSAFGILIGTKIYRWGLDGVHGVRLNDIRIDRQRVLLTFGDTAQTTRIELLHGITERKAVLGVKEKFWYETGVAANINGW